MKFHSLSLLFFFLFTCFNCYSNEVIDSSKIDPWLGTWSGMLEIFNSSGKTQTIPMKIKHFSTDTIGTYGWYLVYGEEATGTRSYFLKTVDEASGHYQVDEKNTILLDEFMIGNKMISNFEVSGSIITSVYTLLDNGNMTLKSCLVQMNHPPFQVIRSKMEKKYLKYFLMR